ncbi:helix-turn-helix transcriptional regulator [Myceligenerans pegani]|uniref:Helix-turn-helix transcriptional regulator n=1 Tax=Myceligenerans pegani TaxID=2776917 RepID=A0ABR9MWH8_9MICO|nr:helix-turn-helix transcriptional regulator [Myceligenerans sp. TRM 65318]MBE1875733.1 helix-turn-helix transcriptional regulator [Myceligenerans sp. TRM 65318]MBE3018004.1 helix-turn-helix transcriptional regulator [Myceligenerans sp. TRM 65318]
MVGRRRWLVERRAAAGLTQEALAARVEVERTTIARWETGANTPGLWVRSRLAVALDLTTEQLDGLLRAEPQDDGTNIVETLPEIQERQEAGRLLVLAAGATIDLEDDASSSWAEPVDRLTSPAPGRIGMTDVEHIRALTTAMRAVDHAHGGGACRDAIAAQVRWTQQLLAADATDEVRRHLLVALGDLHNLAGWASFDVGLFTTARRHFARALELGRHAGDASLSANVLYRLGKLHLHRGLSKEALRFFQFGQMLAQGGCGVTDAILWANAAWAYAFLGDRTQMNTALSAATALYESADHDRVESWAAFFDHTDLHASAGVALTSLTDPGEADTNRAIEHLSAAVAQRGPDMARSRSFEHTALAVAHLRVGAIEEGIAFGHEAIDEATAVRSVRTVEKLEPLRAEAARLTTRSGATDLAHRISTLQPTA